MLRLNLVKDYYRNPGDQRKHRVQRRIRITGHLIVMLHSIHLGRAMGKVQVHIRHIHLQDQHQMTTLPQHSRSAARLQRHKTLRRPFTIAYHRSRQDGCYLLCIYLSHPEVRSMGGLSVQHWVHHDNCPRPCSLLAAIPRRQMDILINGLALALAAIP